MPNYSRKIGNKLTSSSIDSILRKNTIDALLQRQHNLRSKIWIKLEKEAKYGTNLPFRVTSSKKFKNKTLPLVFGDFGDVPELLSGTVQRDGCVEKKQCEIFSND